MTDQLSADEQAADDGRSADTTGEPAAIEAGDDGAEAADDASGDDASDPGETEPGEPAGAFAQWRAQRRSRPTHWDRPPEPRDWRFYVGTLGKVLIATGLLMLGFVGYQLWGTGIETARAQNRLENEFEAALAEARADESTDAPVAADDPDPEPAPAGGRTATDTAIEPTDEATDDSPGPSDDARDPAAEPAVGADEAPAAESATVVGADLSEVAVEQDIPMFDRGDPLALLEIPAIGRRDIVVPGVSLNDLKSGPGHYPDTPLPGQLGNAAIAGHRTTYGAPFFDVDQLGPGDEIIVTMVTGDRFVYEVTGTEVVGASDYWVVGTSDPAIAELTLTSCHPKYTARDRIVVHSILNPAKSSNVGVPTYYDLDADDEPIPGDDPVLIADDPPDDAPTEAPVEPTADDSTDDGSADGGSDETEDAPVAATDDDVATTEPATEPADAATSDDEQVAAAPTAADQGDPGDAFVQGWFDDRGAWPQIMLWGAALALIVVFGYRLARRYRRDSLGILVGVVPFLVALYFFYQNVNRLLPPGL